MPGPVSTVSNNMPLIIGFALAVGAVSVGVWGAKGTRGLNGLGGSRRRHRQLRGADEVRELEIYINNESGLYGQMKSIQKNLITKMAKGIYDKTKAEKLWMYLVESGAKKYVKDVAGSGTWHQMFSMSDRREVAKELNEHFLTEAEYGNYDNYLPKKYRKKAA